MTLEEWEAAQRAKRAAAEAGEACGNRWAQ